MKFIGHSESSNGLVQDTAAKESDKHSQDVGIEAGDVPHHRDVGEDDNVEGRHCENDCHCGSHSIFRVGPEGNACEKNQKQDRNRHASDQTTLLSGNSDGDEASRACAEVLIDGHAGVSQAGVHEVPEGILSEGDLSVVAVGETEARLADTTDSCFGRGNERQLTAVHGQTVEANDDFLLVVWIVFVVEGTL